MPQDNFVIFVTTPSGEEAETIAKALVEERLAACANIVPSVSSIFRWEGKVERETEALVILKSRRKLLDRLIERVRDLHSYEVPEVIALQIAAGSKAYLDWIKQETELAPRTVPKDRRATFGPGF